ncbi:MAG: secretion system protein [Bacteroidales bacterium]|nr:secretion system protein [Bacteroidales bacterium]
MDPMLLILIFGAGAVVVLLVIGIVVTARSERSLVEERLGRYLEEEQVREKKAGRSTPVADWLNRRVEKSTWGGGIARELARADLKLKPAEYVIIMILSGIGSAFVFWYLMGRGNPFPIPIFPILGFVVGLFFPRMYVRRQQNKRLVHFSEQLADMLNLMVNGLRAGYSTMQAMEAVSREMPSPISDEFRRVVQEMQLGISMEQALSNLLRRIPSGDLDLVITAMNVQREVGGNLAEILDTISHTIRERIRIKGEIRVLTSQVMYSGKFLSLMPVIVIAILYFLNREYMMEFFKPESFPCGYIALGVGGLMIISGYFVMTKIATIEV